MRISHPARGVSCLLSLLLFLALCRPISAIPYTHLTYAQIHFRLTQLADKYPTLIKIFSAQKAFSLPHVGVCSQLKSSTDTTGHPAPCTVWILHLTNHTSLPSDPTRPELLVSGEVHGNEVVGPLATLAFLDNLVSSYGRDPFATRMIDTRLITLVPMTNAIGYHLQERFERQPQTPSNQTVPHTNLPDLRIDPNRDFPYDQPNTRCLRTVAARALNELFLRHLFRAVVTFHGGTNALAYEWGDSTHCNNSRICPLSPDTKFMHALAERMSNFAGPAGKFEAKYPIGDMGKLVYPVHGGMEDWAYGAGWTSGGNIICTPDTLGGYHSEIVRHRQGDEATKRAITYLVEMSSDKRPAENTLGDSDAILHPGQDGDGHVPRNVRLLRALVDSVEPYVVLMPATDGAVLKWRVGGAFSVDGAMVQWSTMHGTSSGEGKHLTGLAGVPEAGGNGKLFEWKLGHNKLKTWGSGGIYCRVAVVVDQTMAKTVQGAVPNLSPQSHVMGGRASRSWKFQAGERHVMGRFVFYSATVKVQVVGRKVVQRVVNGMEWGEVGEGRLHARSDMEVFKELVRAEGGGVLLTATSEASTGLRNVGKIVMVSSAVLAVLMIVGWGLRWVIRRKSQSQGFMQMEDESLADAFTIDDESATERLALRSGTG